MQFKKIGFDSIEEIEGCLSREISPEEFSCENSAWMMAIWAKVLNAEYAIENGQLFVRTNFAKYGRQYRYSTGLAKIFDIERNPSFIGVTRSQAEKIVKFNSDYEVTPVRDAFDYVYERESLANLAGKKLAGKRNHMNAFLREYSEAKFLPLDAKRCLEFYPHWVDEHLMNEDLFFKAEGEGLVHILQNWDRTPFVGGMIEYKGRVIAFSISEVMNDEMAITHFEKADRNYRGSYTAINKWMAESLAVRYINREDDLGIEGLRHTKTMYRPVFMVEKFKVSRKGE